MNQAHIKVPILCYHSHIISSADYRGNGHIALADDLELIAAQDKTVVPLTWLLDAMAGRRNPGDLRDAVVLTFDDGSVADFMPIEHPQFGSQPGLLPVMQQHAARHPQASRHLHATSFVIACGDARQSMDEQCLFGLDWMHDRWWRQAEASGMLSIESHSWNHNNAVCADVPDGQGDEFYSVNTHAQASRQIRDAAQHIGVISGRRPEIFAYPYGHMNEYLEHEYLPEYRHEHGMRCALTTRAEYADMQTSRWSIPRFVHGEHWRDPQTLNDIINP